jgi:precorrin-6A/cobalt-precorrin-6A reductase
MPTMDSQRGIAAVSARNAAGSGGLNVMPNILPNVLTRVLILGGTTEARGLAERLAGRAGLDITLSLAGRTTAPAALPVPVRSGGFGGAEGLADYLAHEHIGVLIDATHPYASAISANAAAAARRTGVAFLALRRPPWHQTDGDRWTEVADVGAAITTLGNAPRRVFVALGRNELAPFAAAPQHHYLIRSVDPVEPPLPLPHVEYITGRGPFSEADDHALLAAHRIDVIVAKNSGGTAIYGKIAAARALGLDVIMLRRPELPDAPTVATVDEAVAWLDQALTLAAARGV